MNQFVRSVEIRWADLDPNFHLRHSVYYDWGAYSRITFLTEQGITAQFMQQHAFGPVIFREECVFRKEIRFGDKVTIDLQMLKAYKDGSRWTMQHNIIKNDDTVAAIITLDGAWIDMAKRKLTLPPKEVYDSFMQMPKAPNFEWTEKEKQNP